MLRSGLRSCSPAPAPLPSSSEVSPAAPASSIISATVARLYLVVRNLFDDHCASLRKTLTCVLP